MCECVCERACVCACVRVVCVVYVYACVAKYWLSTSTSSDVVPGHGSQYCRVEVIFSRAYVGCSALARHHIYALAAVFEGLGRKWSSFGFLSDFLLCVCMCFAAAEYDSGSQAPLGSTKVL